MSCLQQLTPGNSCQTGKGKQQGLSSLDNNRFCPSWYYLTIIFPRLANSNIVSLSVAPHHSGPAAGFCTDIFPPWLITLDLGGSKPVMNNFWMWGPSIDMKPWATCPRLLCVTWGVHISWRTFPFKSSGWAQGNNRRLPSLKVEVWEDYPAL